MSSADRDYENDCLQALRKTEDVGRSPDIEEHEVIPRYTAKKARIGLKTSRRIA
ncbi:MAG: hypothetical protein ACLR7F_04255 [Waltera sp.]